MANSSHTATRFLKTAACLGLLAGCQSVHEETSEFLNNRPGPEWRSTTIAISPGSSSSGQHAAPGEYQATRQAESAIQQTAHQQSATPREPDDPTKPPEANATEWPAVAHSETQHYPIDLPTALRLANASNLEVAVVRERVNASYARVEGAEALWLPNLTTGTQYLLHEGTIQRAAGDILDVRRSSLLVGGGPTLAVDVADAVFEPLIARQLLCADVFAAEAATHNTLLRVAEGYLDLLSAHGHQAIAEETFKNANELVRLTDEFVKQEVGLKSDAARALTERGIREQQLQAAQEKIILASAVLSQLLRLDAQVQLTPVESQVVPLEVVDADVPLPELVAQGLQSRPELAEQLHLVQASVERLHQAQYGPLIPSVLLGYQGGGFGGGTGSHFGTFQDRNDLTAAAVWELRNFGFGDHALRKVRESQYREANLRWMQTADRVAIEVVAAHRLVQTRRQQMSISGRTVNSAKRSFDLNMARIRGGAGLPIEVLQSLQALDRARQDYLSAVIAFSKSQFRLLNAIGSVPQETNVAP